MQIRAQDEIQDVAPSEPANVQYQHPDASGAQLDEEAAAAAEMAAQAAPAQTPAVSDKVGRNDPCPCGSGKKYKHCHGKLN